MVARYRCSVLQKDARPADVSAGCINKDIVLLRLPVRHTGEEFSFDVFANRCDLDAEHLSVRY
jgi:hypothetical protein